MKEKWYKNKEKIYLLVVMAVYFILASIVVFTHEPFRDEAQAWLIARDTNIIEMFSLAKYEGSPMLWHCLVNILTTLGLPYISINIMHLILNLITVYIFNKYAPFNKYIKLGVTFSHIMLYQYLAIARSYILVPLLLFSIAIIYEKRHEKTGLYCVLLLLLQNVCLYSIPISITLFVTYIFEKVKLKQVNWKNLLLFAVITITMVISLVLLINPVKEEPLYKLELPKSIGEFIEGGFKALKSIGFIIIPFIGLQNLKIVCGFVILLLAVISLWKDKKVLMFFLISTIIIGGIFAFLDINILLRHVYIYVIVYLFACWIAKEVNVKYIKFASIECVILIYAVQLIWLIGDSSCDIIMEYSNSKTLYEKIIESGYDNYEIFALESPYASSILPYFKDKKILSLEDNKRHTYVIWNKEFNNKINQLDINRAIYDAVKKYDSKVLFIGNEKRDYSQVEWFELVYPKENEKDVVYEELKVYKLKTTK